MKRSPSRSSPRAAASRPRIFLTLLLPKATTLSSGQLAEQTTRPGWVDLFPFLSALPSLPCFLPTLPSFRRSFFLTLFVILSVHPPPASALFFFISPAQNATVPLPSSLASLLCVAGPSFSLYTAALTLFVVHGLCLPGPVRPRGLRRSLQRPWLRPCRRRVPIL